MARRIDDEDEGRRPWVLRFITGAFVGLVLSVVALAVVSLYLLPPAELPPEPAQGQLAAGAEGTPETIAGIEVAKTPAYVPPPGGESATQAPAAEEFGPIELAGPALSVNAVAFPFAADEALVAVIVDNAAADPLLQDQLFALGMAVTVGVVAGWDGDRVTAERAREASLEVVAQLPLAEPGTARGAELEYGMAREIAAERTQLLLRRLPMAVAVARPLASPAPPNITTLSGIFDVIEPLGFGYVEVGLGPGDLSPGEALGRSVPLVVSRHSVPAGASATEAYAVLDRAAAEAAAGGVAVVVAAPGEALLAALQLAYGVEGGSVARLAPLSAVMRRAKGG